MPEKYFNSTEFESPCKVNRTEDELKMPSFYETMNVMKNYSLKQTQKDLNKLNNEYIILLKDRIKELEAQNQILIEALKK